MGLENFSVYIKTDKGNVVRVNFGVPNMPTTKNKALDFIEDNEHSSTLARASRFSLALKAPNNAAILKIATRFASRIGAFASPPPPKLKDLQDAIEHADIYGDQGWTIEDFNIEFLGYLGRQELNAYDDIDSWLDTEEGEELNDGFRGQDWLQRANKWTQNTIPPVIIITAPVVSEGQLHTQVGDGRGRINYAIATGIKVPVYHMTWKHELIAEE